MFLPVPPLPQTQLSVLSWLVHHDRAGWPVNLSPSLSWKVFTSLYLGFNNLEDFPFSLWNVSSSVWLGSCRALTSEENAGSPLTVSAALTAATHTSTGLGTSQDGPVRLQQPCLRKGQQGFGCWCFLSQHTGPGGAVVLAWNVWATSDRNV